MEIKDVEGTREQLLPALRVLRGRLKYPNDLADGCSQVDGYTSYFRVLKGGDANDVSHHRALDDVWIATLEVLGIEKSNYVTPEIFFSTYLCVAMEYWGISEEELDAAESQVSR